MKFISTECILNVQHLSHCLGGKIPQVNNVSFDIYPGECIALVGPNGSGKSTVLRLIIGELSPQAGAITIQGRALNTFSHQERARTVAILTQHDIADARLSVEDYVALGRLPWVTHSAQCDHESIIIQAMQETGILHLRTVALGKLSGGERQRAGFARVLAQQPTLILLDEPTNHLDPLARHQLMSLVKRKKIATLVVLHDLEMIEPFADRVMMLNKGKLVCHGTPAQVLDSRWFSEIFGMRSLCVTHPENGRCVRIFEAVPTVIN